MSDVWGELKERLKQKAKSYLEITLEIAKEVDVAKAEEGKEPKIKEPKWVKLEDVLETLKELKQNYVLIPKRKLMEKLAEIKLYGTKINGQLSDKPEYSPRYLADFIEKELLRKNEG